MLPPTPNRASSGPRATRKLLRHAFQRNGRRMVVLIGQTHFLASSFCLKTDLKHLENLSIQPKCPGAFFPRKSGVTRDASDGLSRCNLQPFPLEPHRAGQLHNGWDNNALFVCENPGEELGRLASHKPILPYSRVSALCGLPFPIVFNSK